MKTPNIELYECWPCTQFLFTAGNRDDPIQKIQQISQYLKKGPPTAKITPPLSILTQTYNLLKSHLTTL